ncbi:hypothetical protein WNY59_15925 [Ahrensia kielensis]|uniref:Uncharacterized protein n=1 Tax=Ahrensia kielensis TaxID=76980 RepID=A0ABU9TBM4_9HYPH
MANTVQPELTAAAMAISTAFAVGLAHLMFERSTLILVRSFSSMIGY